MDAFLRHLVRAWRGDSSLAAQERRMTVPQRRNARSACA